VSSSKLHRSLRGGIPFTRIWCKISTAEDPEWTGRYHSADPGEKAFGARGISANSPTMPWNPLNGKGFCPDPRVLAMAPVTAPGIFRCETG